VVLDRGIQVDTLAGVLGPQDLSGAWFSAGDGRTEIRSLGGVVSSTQGYWLDLPELYSRPSAPFGSLFLVYVIRNPGDPTTARVDLTVRDAAKAGQMVGRSVTLSPPVGALTWPSCESRADGVICSWSPTAGLGQLEQVVTRTDVLAATTVTARLTPPATVETCAVAGFYSFGSTGLDGVAVVR
jgi:hypothetical protein